MSDLNQFSKDLQSIREAIESKLPEIAITMSLSMKALAERQAKEEGFGATYSTNPVPAWFFHGKELNAGGTSWLKKHGVKEDGTQGEAKKKRRKKKDDPDPGFYDTTGTWGEFRDAQGLQSDHVDLSYSNMMWSNMQPVEVRQEGYIYLAPLGATNKEAQEKMYWNFLRYGDFVGRSLPDNWRDIAADIVLDEFDKVLQQFLPK